MPTSPVPKRWRLHTKPSPKTLAAFANQLPIHSIILSLLWQRGIRTYESAKSYFRPSLQQLYDPFQMRDMDKAVQRIQHALVKKEPVLVYGDYDVDGTTAQAMVYRFLHPYCAQLAYYAPDRYTEGYGLSLQGVAWANTQGYRLIITLDCGIKAYEAITLARKYGIDVIVCDHHKPGDSLPAAYAILNPKRKDCAYPFEGLSGCGVGFKLLQALALKLGLAPPYNYLDLVATSIAADLVPLQDENRILAYFGLQQLRKNPSPGLAALMNVANMQEAVTIRDLVFKIGPRINAAGRLVHARHAIQLLIAKTQQEATSHATFLDKTNKKRKVLDQATTDEALSMIKGLAAQDPKGVVLFKPSWHKGIVGIVAARCIENYYRPTIILTQSGDKAVGSARSVAGYNVYRAIKQCAHLLDQYGGHRYAAGLTLALEHVEAFQQCFNQVVAQSITAAQLEPVQHVDLSLPLEDITPKLYRILRQMAPFGNGNMQPVFAATNVKVKTYTICKKLHLKCKLEAKNGLIFDAIGFYMAPYATQLAHHQQVTIAYQIMANMYRGKMRLTLHIKDIKC